MKLSIISFTKGGNVLNQRLCRTLRGEGDACTGYGMGRFAAQTEGCGELTPVRTTLSVWVQTQFSQVDGLIFIGAAGIAVRGIAPFLADKMTDPAVVVADEKGRFAVSLLSGHMGGANDLAERIARISGGQAVITTATDVNQRFAVDVFARDRDLAVTDRILAKQISADVLEGIPVGFCSDFPVEGQLPSELSGDRTSKNGLWITCRAQVENPGFLRLVPRAVVLGIGCRKGTGKSAIRALAERVLLEAGLDGSSVYCLASIDLKKEEPGLVEFAGEMGVELHTYSAEELNRVPGIYTDSKFVAETTGVGNVCERAAVLTARRRGQADESCLILKKRSSDGVTVAASILNWKVIL